MQHLLLVQTFVLVVKIVALEIKCARQVEWHAFDRLTNNTGLKIGFKTYDWLGWQRHKKVSQKYFFQDLQTSLGGTSSTQLHFTEICESVTSRWRDLEYLGETNDPLNVQRKIRYSNLSIKRPVVSYNRTTSSSTASGLDCSDFSLYSGPLFRQRFWWNIAPHYRGR